MILKSIGDFGPRKRALWRVLRRLLPSRPRFFFEGRLEIPGQMWFAERRLLYETIRTGKPVRCFEIGTWLGGGSTLFIARALYENGRGVLHTIEVDAELQRSAKRAYEKYLPELLPFVEFHLGDYRQEFARHLKKMGGGDCLFLDGAENGEQTLEQYRFFDPWLGPGSLLLVHDWLTEKTRLLRPEIERSGKWTEKALLLPPVSVGMVLLERRA